MVEYHIHQWKPISKSAEVVVNNKCIFVCECGAFKEQKMTEIKE